MDPELYWISGSPYAWRVMLALEVKQVPYVSRLLDSSKGDLKTGEFLRLNPRGQVPVLTHGDYVLTESLAILAYLDREFPTPPLFGARAYETAGDLGQRDRGQGLGAFPAVDRQCQGTPHSHVVERRLVHVYRRKQVTQPGALLDHDFVAERLHDVLAQLMHECDRLRLVGHCQPSRPNRALRKLRSR